MNLEFINYRTPQSYLDMKPFERKQILFDLHRDGMPDNIDEALEQLMADEEISGLELVDVADETGKILYQAWFYDFGTGMFFENETLNEVGGACQHYVECDDEELFEALKKAYKNANPKIEQGMRF